MSYADATTNISCLNYVVHPAVATMNHYRFTCYFLLSCESIRNDSETYTRLEKYGRGIIDALENVVEKFMKSE